jgi:branched-chain amino acid transport system permease protein
VGIYTEYWTLVLGIVLMLLIFFMPDGVLGMILIKNLKSQARNSKQ